MNKVIVLGLFIFTLFTSQTCTKQSCDQVIAFYNVENLFDTINSPNHRDGSFTPNGKKRWTSERYLQKQRNIADALKIDGEFPALIGLAEIENQTVLKDFISINKLSNYKIVHFDSPDFRGIDVAAIYNSKVFDLQVSGITSGTSVDDYKTRDLLFIEGSLKGHPPIRVVICHWPSRYGGKSKSASKRLSASRKTTRLLDSLHDLRPMPYLVMGDFNDTPSDPSIDSLTKRLNNNVCSFEKTGTIMYKGDWYTYDFFISKNLSIDTCWISDNTNLLQLQGKYKGYPKRTYAGNYYLGGYSDHLPIFLKLHE